MSDETVRLIKEFNVRKSDGTLVSLSMYQSFRLQNYRSGQTVEIPGLKYIKTEDGGTVNRVNSKTFEILTTGEILTSAEEID